MTGATQIAPEGDAGEPPEGSPWTVTGVPSAGFSDAEPQPEWEAADVPEGTGMVVTLEWDIPTDDWDLFVDKLVDDEWEQVGSSATGAPQTEERVVVFDYVAGDRFRARAQNWLAPTSPQAEISVSYETAALTQLGPAGTRNNDLEQTGWAFTNIRPNDYRGLTHAIEQPRTEIVLDLVKHDETTVDVSGDFLRVDTDTPAPVIAGEEIQLATTVYNHGGAAVTGATFALHDADPADGGDPLETVTLDLGGFARDEVTFDYTPVEGMQDLYVVASAPGDVTPGNDIVRTELEAWPEGASVLLVDNDFGWTHEEPYEALLRSLGVTYAVVEGEPPAEVLADYDAVIWIPRTVSGADGVLSSEGQEAMEAYLADGGSLWFATTRAGAYVDGDWLGEHFGFAIEQNLLNSMGTIEGLGDDIGGDRTIDVGYLDGRPYIDYGTVPDDIVGTATGVLAHTERPDRVVATKVEGATGFRTFYGLPIGLVSDGAERLALVSEVLDFLGVQTGAPDPDALHVHFERFQHVQVGEGWPVTVGALDPAGVDGVRIAQRHYGGHDWTRTELDEVDDGVWTGTIPGTAIANNGIQYFVEVDVDGETVQIDGGEHMPHVASAPYGDPADVDYCAPEPVEPVEPVDPEPTDPGDAAVGVRLGGADRYGTAVEVSRGSFADDGSAGAVVLARGDEPSGFADALAGTPLAVDRDAPLLITLPDRLLPATEAEIVRVLPSGATVYLLGGEQALAPEIEQRIRELGFTTERVYGQTRIETAVAIARELGEPEPLLITTGNDFPDALAAGAAAAHAGGAVLLTPSEQRHPATDAYLATRPGVAQYAVGGPAARPYPDATPVFGPAREETAVAVAETFFDAPPTAGLATRSTFPDSLTGGAHAARNEGPVLLTATETLHAAPGAYLCGLEGLETLFTYGGTAAIAHDVAAAALARVEGEGCD
jgi:hypothetical protein